MKLKERIQSFVNNNGFLQSVIKVGSGNIIGQSIAIITTPILSRIYNDVAYGDRAIIISTAAIIINISTIGLNSAIMKPENDKEAKKVFTTALYMNFIVSTMVAVICVLLQDFFHLVNVSGSYIIAVILTWLYMVIYTVQSLVLIYTNRKGKYNRLFLNPIIGAVMNIVLAIPLGLLGFGYEGFLITTIVSQLTQIIHMTWDDIPVYRHYTFKDFKDVIKEYKDYILFQYPSNFISNLAIEYPTQFLGRTFSSGDIGSYSMCLNILKYPMRLISAPISTVYFRTATEYHRLDKNLAEFTYRIINKILTISIIPVVLFSIFSETIFTFALGPSWSMAGTIAAVKAVEYVMLFCSDCVSYCRVSIGRQGTNLLYSIIKIAVTIAFSIFGYSIYKSLMGTIVFITIGNTFLNVLDMALNFYWLGKKYLVKYLVTAGIYVTVMSLVIMAKYLI